MTEFLGSVLGSASWIGCASSGHSVNDAPKSKRVQCDSVVLPLFYQRIVVVVSKTSILKPREKRDIFVGILKSGYKLSGGMNLGCWIIVVRHLSMMNKTFFTAITSPPNDWIHDRCWPKLQSGTVRNSQEQSAAIPANSKLNLIHNERQGVIAEGGGRIAILVVVQDGMKMSLICARCWPRIQEHFDEDVYGNVCPEHEFLWLHPFHCSNCWSH